ncbi:MAG TPA: hypothetical protein VFN67_07080 [Polyangiales bacterium]|nr:hypothetical protein [Polyangiales bacterium]
MTAIAVAELTVDAPRDVAFAKFIDFSHWDLWMPADFRPVTGPARALRQGDKVKVSIGPKGRISLRLEVLRVRENIEICWRGGPAGLLQGDHSFFFSDADGNAAKTRIRSEEPMTGLFTVGPLGARVERALADGTSVLLKRFSSFLASGAAVP